MWLSMYAPGLWPVRGQALSLEPLSVPLCPVSAPLSVPELVPSLAWDISVLLHMLRLY
jgi:hypothetical protein